MTGPPAVWLREADVVRLLDLPQAIEELRAALRAEATRGAASLPKTHLVLAGGGALHALGGVIGAVAGSGGLAGTKTWAHTGGGATPLLVLWRVSDGALEAVIEAFALGQLRTSGVAGVATDLLADRDADELAIVGTGKQALAQVAAVANVRHLRQVHVFSPTREHRDRFAAEIAAELAIPARVADSVEKAVLGAPIVTLATRATLPFLHAAMLAAGAHVNAIGGITPERAEMAPDVVTRADLIVSDAPGDAVRLSSELRGLPRPPVALCAVVAGEVVRPAAASLTIFKAMGTGLADVALGAAVLERARRAGLGRELERPERVRPRLSTGGGPLGSLGDGGGE